MMDYYMIKIARTMFTLVIYRKTCSAFFLVHDGDGHVRNNPVSSKGDSKGMSFYSIQSVAQQSSKFYLNGFSYMLNLGLKCLLKTQVFKCDCSQEEVETFRGRKMLEGVSLEGMYCLSSSVSLLYSLKDEFLHRRQQNHMTIDQTLQSFRLKLNSSLTCLFFACLFVCFETLLPRLGLNSWQSSCLSLLNLELHEYTTPGSTFKDRKLKCTM